MKNKTDSSPIFREFEGLDPKTINILISINILNVNDLISQKETDLLKIPKIGPQTIARIRKWLNDKGLDLKPEFSSFSIKLSDCRDLYWPVVKMLQQNGVFTLEDLLSKTEDDILEFTGLYPFNYSVMKKWLAKYHLCLATPD